MEPAGRRGGAEEEAGGRGGEGAAGGEDAGHKQEEEEEGEPELLLVGRENPASFSFLVVPGSVRLWVLLVLGFGRMEKAMF